MIPAADATTAIPDRAFRLLAVLVIIGGAVAIAAVGYRLAVDRVPGPDDSLYASEAVRWLAGQPLTTMSGDPAAVRPPVYVAALAAATAATGDWQLAERVVAALSLLVVVGAVAAIAWSVAGAAAAVLAVAVFTVPGATEAFARSAIDGSQAALGLLGVAIGHVAIRRDSWSAVSAVGVGVCVGLAVLTKETALALAPWPALLASTQPAATLRPAIRWAAIATAATALVLLPWWLWVDLSVGTLFPTRIGGVRAHAGVVALAAAAVLGVVAAWPRVGDALARMIGRIGERRRWWLAVAFTAAWATAIIVAFLASDARHAISRLPPLRPTLDALLSVLGLVLLPAVAVPVFAVAVVAAGDRPSLRGVLHVVLLTGGIVVIVLIKNWDPRSALVPALTLSLLVPLAATAVVRRSLASWPTRRRIARAATVAVVGIVVGANVTGMARAIAVPPTPTESQRWNGPVVRAAADWLSSRVGPGETITASWLFATSLDAFTGGRLIIEETPTLQARVGRAREPILVPTGTLFRETAHLPRTAPTDWLFVRRHPSEGYLVALSANLLADTITGTDSRYLVLSGEHPAQSTATIAATVDAWPGVERVAAFASGDAEIVILAIDQASFAVGGFPTQLNVALLRDWRALVRTSRRGVEPGAALCEVLAGRALEVIPDDDRSQLIVSELLPAGCPLEPLPGPPLGNRQPPSGAPLGSAP